MLALSLIVGLEGCANGSSIREYSLPVASIELGATPFFPQAEYQCGPAALATVLVADGAAVTPEALTPYIYLPGRKGSLQAEIVAATRRHGRVPYVIQPIFDNLLAEVASGTPVLVMQNLGLRMMPRWHYAVVIGYDADSDSLLLRSGTRERLAMNRVRFQATWARANNWALVAVSPHKPPATAQVNNWLLAASAFEELNQAKLAAQAYEVATSRWPQQPLAWQALANARYGLKDLAGAETALRRALQLAPSAVASNNLAHVLHEQGCSTQALAEISRAQAMADANKLRAVLAKTRAGIEAHAGETASGCSQ
ncbi:MAG: PA2778 family cysteine peptidase [Porticoccaceae bacterium]|nr:PA2778 family cysteine peptidase [Porticoccaceae bacterium]